MQRKGDSLITFSLCKMEKRGAVSKRCFKRFIVYMELEWSICGILNLLMEDWSGHLIRRTWTLATISSGVTLRINATLETLQQNKN